MRTVYNKAVIPELGDRVILFAEKEYRGKIIGINGESRYIIVLDNNPSTYFGMRVLGGIIVVDGENKFYLRESKYY